MMACPKSHRNANAMYHLLCYHPVYRLQGELPILVRTLCVSRWRMMQSSAINLTPLPPSVPPGWTTISRRAEGEARLTTLWQTHLLPIFKWRYGCLILMLPITADRGESVPETWTNDAASALNPSRIATSSFRRGSQPAQGGIAK